LDETTEELRNSAITAQLNQGSLSRDVGSGLDIVIGMRNLFGVKRLGMDLRGGWFFPGAAFKPDGPDKGFSVVSKFWW
jgi:alginate production protein